MLGSGHEQSPTQRVSNYVAVFDNRFRFVAIDNAKACEDIREVSEGLAYC